MSQQLSDFDTEHGLALLQNSTMQMLLAQHPNEIAFIQDALQLSDEEARLVGRLKTVKGSHAQMLWINGTRGRGRVALRVGPTEYWAFTSDQGARRAAARRQARRARPTTPGRRSASSPATEAAAPADRSPNETQPRDRAQRMPGSADDAELRAQHVGEQPARTSTPEGARADRAARSADRAAAGGVRAVRRRRDQHAELPDRPLRGRAEPGRRAGLRHRRPDRRAVCLRRRRVSAGRSPRPPSSVALELELTTDLYAVDAASRALEFELRVIATGPQFAIAGDRVGLARLCSDWRAKRHALIVVDCGTLQRDADRPTIELATHVAWVLPATASGVRRAERVLARPSGAAPAASSLLARRDRRARTPRAPNAQGARGATAAHAGARPARP